MNQNEFIQNLNTDEGIILASIKTENETTKKKYEEKTSEYVFLETPIDRINNNNY